MLQSVLFIYVCLLVWAALYSNRMIFRPPPPAYTEQSFPVTMLETSRGDRIAACHLSNRDARYTLLLAHGNGEDLGNVVPFAKILHEQGFAVMLFDYPGYGLSSGRPSERGAYAAIDAAYDHLITTLNVPAERIIAHGRSVGGGPVIDLAARHPVAGVIAESCFLSAFRVMTHIRVAPFDKFNNLAKLKKLSCPLLSIHGRLDQVIPFRHGERLYNAASVPKQHLWVDEAGHNDLAWVASRDYINALKRFADGLPTPRSAEQSTP